MTKTTAIDILQNMQPVVLSIEPEIIPLIKDEVVVVKDYTLINHENITDILSAIESIDTNIVYIKNVCDLIYDIALQLIDEDN